MVFCSSSPCQQGFSPGIACRNSRDGTQLSLWMIWWQKDRVIKGQHPQPPWRRVSLQKEHWLALLPLYLYYMWLHPASAVLDGRGVSEGLNVNWWVRETSCVARSTLKSQSRLGKRKAVCLMVSTYFWRAQCVGGGVVQEQCVCLYVKLCIKAAPLIIYSWIYSVALGKASSVILNMALRQLISYNQIFF